MPLPKSPIRKLAWDYYLGKVEPRDEYLRRRKLLVDAVVSGGPTPLFDASAAADLNVDADAAVTLIPDADATMQPVSGGVTRSPPSSPNRPLIAGVILVATLLVVFGALYFTKDEAPLTEVAGPPVTSVVRTAPSIPNDLQVAIAALQSNGWNDTAASHFLAEWSSLAPAEQKSLRDSSAISAITELVASRASELMTIAGAGIDISEPERQNIDALLASLSLPAAKWPEPILTPIEEGLEPAVTSKPTVVATESKFVVPPQVPTMDTEDQRSDTDPAQPEIIHAPAEMASANPSIVPLVAISEKKIEVETEKVVETKRATKQVAKNARPAAVVLSERSGCSSALASNRVRTCRDFLSSKVRAPRMMVIPPGSFTMGDAQRATESPQVEVNIPSPLAFSTHEISFREFQLYCKNSGAPCPSNSGNDKQLPVVGVNWQEAADYTAWLSTRTGKHYRLPSEAEWEYAARAGTSSNYPFGDNLMVTQARFSTRSREATGPLANNYQAINPNAFQLYHMVGNVREWVADGWQDHHDSQVSTGSPRPGTGKRVVRGGSFADDADQLRSSARQPLDGSSRDSFTGFRVVLDFSAKTS